MTVAFITGVQGQDGQLLSGVLRGRGVEVHGLVYQPGDQSSGQPGSVSPELSDLPLLQGVHLHAGDLSNPDHLGQILREVRPNQIYNLGGISSVGQSWSLPVETGLATGIGAVGVFREALGLQESTGDPVAVVQASSAEIFGSPLESPQTEETVIAPVSPYGAAKAYAHFMAQSFRSRGLAVSNMIFYGHESPLRPPTFVSRKITQAVARISAGDPEPVSLGNIDAARDWGWAPDYVLAMTAAADKNAASGSGDDVIIATGEAHTVKDFLRAAFAYVGIEDWERFVRIDPRFFRPVDPVTLVGDPSKAREILGWQPNVGFEELVGRMVQHDVDLLQA